MPTIVIDIGGTNITAGIFINKDKRTSKTIQENTNKGIHKLKFQIKITTAL